jgi:hypothetical protein
MWPQWKDNKLFYLLTAVLMVYAVVWLGANAVEKLNIARTGGRAPREPATIVVDGEGRVTAAPNIARIDLGLLTEKATVQEAQKENSEKMNRLISEIKKLEIDAKDIQTTQYQIYPQYDYEKGKQTLRGYAVSQSVNVKIRDLDKISQVLAKAGEAGANQVGGLQFTLDDEENLRVLSRVQAIEKAKEKARALARDLGVRLVRIVSFNESAGFPPGPIPFALEGGRGGEAPQVEAGTLEIKVNVIMTYEIE